MARKSGSKQLKRQRAPRSWSIHRKENTWAPNPHPGSHQRQESVPLVLILRETLGYAQTSKEAEKVVNRSQVTVDGRVRRDHRFPVGLMDVVSMPSLGKRFRMLPTRGHGLSLVQIEENESNYKICKIIGKKTIRQGHVQLALHDGRTILVSERETQPKGEGIYSADGALQVALPTQRIIKYIPFQAGSLALVTDGRNEGSYGKIATVTPGTEARPKMARIETQHGTFDTLAAYVLPVGIETPLVSLEK